MSYSVFFNTLDESFPVKEFDTEADAKDYVDAACAGELPLSPLDNCLRNNHFWYDIYSEDSIIVYLRDDISLNEPIYTSPKYYLR